MRRIIFAAVGLALLGCSPGFAQSTIVPTTNSSAAIATGNTFQTLLAAVTNSLNRRSLTVVNNNTNTDSCWLFIGAAAATKATSILLLPGGSYTRYYPYVPSDAIQATCTTTADTIYVDIQ